MLTREFRELVLNAIKVDRKRFDSDSSHARSLQISKSQYSRINRGDIEQVLGDPVWVRLANKFGINQLGWNTARTPVFNELYLKLEASKGMSWNGIVCDLSDIGKTHTAKVFIRENKNSYYIDCSRCKTRNRFIKAIAKELGVNGDSNDSMLENCIDHINTLYKPMLILDEAGDLAYEAFLEIKSLINGVEGNCSVFLLGANGLKKKMERAKNSNKVGYEEIFSRLGSKYQRISPEGTEAIDEFKKLQAALVIKANDPNAQLNSIYAKSEGSLRRVKLEMQKQQLISRKELTTPTEESEEK